MLLGGVEVEFAVAGIELLACDLPEPSELLDSVCGIEALDDFVASIPPRES